MTNNLSNSKIQRNYSCSNKDCGCVISFVQKVKDPWKKLCPLCRKKSLLLDSATSCIQLLSGTTGAKTLGMIFEKNRQRKEKEEGYKPNPDRPFWRSSHKQNFKILRDPKNYIEGC